MSSHSMLNYVEIVMGVMVQRWTVMLAARPYVCYYRDFTLGKQLLLSLNWTLFVIFDYDNFMPLAGGSNTRGSDACGRNRSK